MGGVRANWFLDGLGADEPVSTGFVGLPPAEERIEDVGVPFDLRDPGVALEKITDLVNREAALFNEGITCPVKDRADTACSACLCAHHQEIGHALQPLCAVGREQERILTLHAHLVAQGRE